MEATDSPIDVSVIVPAWKAADFIGAAVASALSSSGVTVEVIAVDDASPDDTFATLQTLAATDPRLRIDRLAVNAGPSAARNRAIELAAGRYIAVLDADDTMAPDRLQRLVNLADAVHADIVVDDMLDVDAQGQRIGAGTFLKANVFRQAMAVDLALWVHFNQPLKPIDCIGYLKPLFRRAALDRLNQRYDPALRNSEDYYIVADLLAKGAVMRYTPEPGYNYRRAATSISHRLKPAETHGWIAAEAAFRARHPQLGASQLAALDARSRLLREIDHFVSAVDLAKGKRIPQFLRHLAGDPHSSLFTLGAFARIAGAKVTGGSAF
jgi:succinoglycan biosynthesis protein ExoO